MAPLRPMGSSFRLDLWFCDKFYFQIILISYQTEVRILLLLFYLGSLSQGFPKGMNGFHWLVDQCFDLGTHILSLCKVAIKINILSRIICQIMGQLIRESVIFF